jgi:micrococcal nuclease
VSRPPLLVVLIFGALVGLLVTRHHGDTYHQRADGARAHGTVVRAIDGDTIDVATRNGTTRVRLLGVDTPETHDPRRPVGCYGPQAASRTRELVAGSSATIVTEPQSGDVHDRYGRTLAYVQLYGRHHGDLGELLLAGGYAHLYAYNNRHFARRSFYELVQARARRAGRGLWRACRGVNR